MADQGRGSWRGRQAFPVTPEVAAAAEAEAPWPLHGVILRSTLLRMLAHRLGVTPGDASTDAAGLQHATAYTEVGASCLLTALQPPFQSPHPPNSSSVFCSFRLS